MGNHWHRRVTESLVGLKENLLQVTRSLRGCPVAAAHHYKGQVDTGKRACHRSLAILEVAGRQAALPSRMERPATVTDSTGLDRDH